VIVANAEAERVAGEGLVVGVDREVGERWLEGVGGLEQAGLEGGVAGARDGDLRDLAAAEVELEVGRGDEPGGPAEGALVAGVGARGELVAEQALERDLGDRGGLGAGRGAARGE